MSNDEKPISLEEQVDLIKKYVSFRQRKRIRHFLEYAGYFRVSRYGKFLLSYAAKIGGKPNQDLLFCLYEFDTELRRVLSYYCNKVEIRFKSALSNACSIKTENAAFYLDKKYYTSSKSERDAKKKSRISRILMCTIQAFVKRKNNYAGTSGDIQN